MIKVPIYDCGNPEEWINFAELINKCIVRQNTSTGLQMYQQQHKCTVPFTSGSNVAVLRTASGFSKYNKFASKMSRNQQQCEKCFCKSVKHSETTCDGSLKDLWAGKNEKIGLKEMVESGNLLAAEDDHQSCCDDIIASTTYPLRS